MPVKKRISHAKSRSGCTNCKKRHVKCDEQGPPCANCIARSSSSTCHFPSRRHSPPSTQPLAIARRTTPESTDSSTNSSPPRTTYLLSHSFPLPIPTNPSPPLPFSPSSHLLELELLHRWTTLTHRSFTSIAEDVPNMTITFPRYGLRYSFLLHGLFALAALESSITSPDPGQGRRYLRAALTYYDAASVSFRSYLPNLGRGGGDLQYSLYMFSALAMAMHMAIPLCCRAMGVGPTGRTGDGEEVYGDEDVVDMMAQLFNLQVGMVELAMYDAKGLWESEYGPALIRAEEIVKVPLLGGLGEGTEEAIQRARRLAIAKGGEDGGDYAAALVGLRFCFTEEKRDMMRGLCVAWPCMAGRHFMQLFKGKDQVALWLLMHWAVMLHRLGLRAWWASSLGTRLVTELSETLMLSDTPETSMDEWWEGIAWARREIGLDGVDPGPTLSLAELSLTPTLLNLDSESPL
ncbi:Fungal Zn(2)-Cys(6) binuclear cluster domain-containing protein 4 [Elsinoe fawcettii]|nr:Fungal Zn(2)-Cys(6) binuclear cluster domain-containing protein 4 [Elsinoe fawcettii]